MSGRCNNRVSGGSHEVPADADEVQPGRIDQCLPPALSGTTGRAIGRRHDVGRQDCANDRHTGSRGAAVICGCTTVESSYRPKTSKGGPLPGRLSRRTGAAVRGRATGLSLLY
jgi:hypothetical protein